LVVLSLVTFPATVQTQSSQTPELFQAELESIHLINLERRQLGLAPLRWNRELTGSARWFAEDAVEAMGGAYCDHVDSLGRSPGQRMRFFGYSHLSTWAENVICGYTTPTSAVRGWMKSPPHRQNIVNASFREVGLGYYRNAAGYGYIVLDLTSDPDYAPVIINDEAINTTSSQVKLYIYNQDSGDDWLDVGSTVDVMIANNPSFSGAQWEPYTLEKDWTLETGEGWRTVYVKTRDRLGRTTIVYDTIYAGASVPAAELTLAHASAFAEGFQLNQLQDGQYTQIEMSLNWSADDTDAGFELLAGAGEHVNDPNAIGGSAFYMPGSGSPTYVRLWSSHFFRDLPAIAYLRLKTSDHLSAQKMLSVVINDGMSDIATLALRGQDFAASDAYQEFELPFTLPTDGGGLLTFQVYRTGSADITWDAASLYTAPVPAVTPLTFRAPDGYFRSSGAQARLLSQNGDFSTPLELYPHLARMGGVPIAIAPQLVSSLPALVLAAPNPDAAPATSTATLVCQGCNNPTWVVTTDTAWLTATVAAGQLTVLADPANLGTGIYTGTVTVTVAGLTNVVPIQLGVTLMVGDLAQLLPQTLFLPAAMR